MIFLVQKITFLKNFLHAMAVLRYLPKLKRDLVLTFAVHFLHDFFIKMFLIFNTLSTDKVSISYRFSISRYQSKCVTKFLFRQLMTSQPLKFIFDHSLKRCTKRKKIGEGKVTKNWISRERKELFRSKKNLFSWLIKSYHLVKKWIIANTSLNYNHILKESFFISQTGDRP